MFRGLDYLHLKILKMVMLQYLNSLGTHSKNMLKDVLVLQVIQLQLIKEIYLLMVTPCIFLKMVNMLKVMFMIGIRQKKYILFFKVIEII